jgi:hypothetical protein
MRQVRETVMKRKRPAATAKFTAARPKARHRRRTSTPRMLAAAWKPTPAAQKVIDACQDVFDNSRGAKSDCNKFVKAVCAKLANNPFAAGDNADAITNKIRDATWRKANGWDGLNQDAKKAKAAADAGELVIGGTTGADIGQTHGHVVVVVSSEALWKNHPYASWGKLGGTGKTKAKMTLAYKLADLPKVLYMSNKP